MKPVSSKGNQPWIFIGRTVVEVEASVLQPRWLTGKESDAGKDWRQKKKLFNGYGFEQTPGDSGGQRSMVCYSPWGHKESHMT